MQSKWNTGRPYTAAGQIIRAKIDADGTILFADDSRSIDGRIAKPRFALADEADLQRRVMGAYDANDYTRDEGSWAFLMMR